MTDFLNFDLCKTSELVSSGELSAAELTKASIDRAEVFQPKLNSFISLEKDEVLEAAESIDKRLRQGESVGSLAGIPLAHKDMFYRHGKITTCGSKIRSKFKGDRTSTALRRLEKAGALYLGGLNMSEFAVGPIGNNVHYGDCLNPWNQEHTPGGSSSGSGAAVASRTVYGALGSDTGGSIRIPSAMCGVVGIKPTQTRVSRFGLMPLSFSFDCSGPLTRTVRDAARILHIIAGHDPKDSTSSRRKVPDYETECDKEVASMRLGIPSNYFYDGLDADVDRLLRDTRKIFEGLKVEIVSVDVPSHDHINLIWAAALAAEASTIHRKWLRDRPDDYGPMVKRRIEFGLYQPATRYLEALTLREKYLRDYCDAVFSKCDALLTPTMPVVAPRYKDLDVGGGESMPELVLMLSRNTRPISYLGLPALSVPCGFGAKGLPAAFQLIGRPFSEGKLFRLGNAYQEVTDWHNTIPEIVE